MLARRDTGKDQAVDREDESVSEDKPQPDRREQAESTHEIAARRRASAMELWRSGVSIAEIGRRIDVTRQQAHRLIAREVDAIRGESKAHELRVLHSEALMDVWYGLYREAVDGKIEAVDRFLRVEERLARLQGLDRAPGDVQPSPAADAEAVSGDDDEVGEPAAGLRRRTFVDSAPHGQSVRTG